MTRHDVRDRESSGVSVVTHFRRQHKTQRVAAAEVPYESSSSTRATQRPSERADWAFRKETFTDFRFGSTSDLSPTRLVRVGRRDLPREADGR